MSDALAPPSGLIAGKDTGQPAGEAAALAASDGPARAERARARPRPGRRPPGLRGYIALLLAVAIAPVGAVGIVQTVIAQRENDALRNAVLVNATAKAAVNETRAIAQAFGVLRTVADLLPLESGLAACNDFLARIVDEQPRYVFASAIGRDGDMICASAPGIGLAEMGGRALLEEMIAKQGPVAHSVPKGRAFETSMLTMSYPVRREGELAGFLTLAMPRALLELLSREAGVEEERHEALFDRAGRVFARSDGEEGDPAWLPDSTQLVTWALETPEAAQRHTPADGVTRIFVTVPVVAQELFALASWPVAEAERASEMRLALAVLFPFGMWIVCVGIAFFAMNSLLLRNVLRLERVMTAFSRGRRSVRMTPAEGAPREVIVLGEGFNRLADRLEADERAMGEVIEEKNALLKEVYHRVKNNLQLIVSMTNLQTREASTADEREALRRLQTRVQGLALVHQRLYEAQSLTAVRMDLLLEELMREIRNVQTDERGRVDISSDTQPVTLEPDRAVPVSLFASEALVNAFKHGFAPDAHGRLSLSLRREAGEIRMCITNTMDRRADAAPVAAGRGGGLGTRLLKGFARQLRGAFTVSVEGERYVVGLSFPEAPAERVVAAGDAGGARAGPAYSST
ncbi:MAG: sensor histidine kinase [Pseudomonadota bacterium]